MKTDFDYRNTELFGPVVFRPDFNNFKPINVNQAWSLFFTASREDKAHRCHWCNLGGYLPFFLRTTSIE
jgi:hypothetical protein